MDFTMRTPMKQYRSGEDFARHPLKASPSSNAPISQPFLSSNPSQTPDNQPLNTSDASYTHDELDKAASEAHLQESPSYQQSITNSETLESRPSLSPQSKLNHPRPSSTNQLSPLHHDSRPPHHVTRRSDDLGAFEASLGHVTQRVTELDAKVAALQTSASHVKAASSTYVQWGSSSCSAASAELVYSGVLGGSWNYKDTGSAVNALCLTLHPVLSDHAVPNDHANLHGGEYETRDSHDQKDPLCAVCRAALPTTVMVPGTNRCESGWTLQYSGFLMAGKYNFVGGTEYICVDSKLESASRSSADEGGHTLYFTVTQCGSLPCDPYVDHTVVTCAVCSK